jgi:dihydroorotase
MPVSCDVSIHHLHLSEMDIGYFDSNARFDPPLRASSDRDALRVAVRGRTGGDLFGPHAGRRGW